MVTRFFSWRVSAWGLVSLSILASLSYNNWLLGVWLNPDLVKANGSISEYSAASQPGHLVFKSLDIISGLLLVGLAYAWWVKLWSSRSGRAIVISTFVLGVANIFDALASLPCSETLDKGCYVPVSLSPSHFQIPAHGYSSTIIAVCYLLLPLAGLVFAYRRRLVAMALISLVVVAAAVGSFITTLWQYDRLHSLTVHTSGLSQQIQMILVGLWLVTAAISINQFKTSRLTKD